MVDEAFVRGIADIGDNRGAMTLDYDKDGDLDVLLVNHGSQLKLYKNHHGNYLDFLKVYVKEKAFGRSSIGAKVWVNVYPPGDDVNNTFQHMEEIGSNAAFLGQSESFAHFGFGKLHQVSLENDDDSTNRGMCFYTT